MIAILAFLGAAILAGTGIFTFFGSYWFQLWQLRKHDERDCPVCVHDWKTDNE